jgi:hypothetical protein
VFEIETTRDFTAEENVKNHSFLSFIPERIVSFDALMFCEQSVIKIMLNILFV